MEKNYTRNLRKNYDYILENLVGKRKNLNLTGGGTVIDLKNTQTELLKTLNNIETAKETSAKNISNSNNNKSLSVILSSLDSELQKLNEKFKDNKYISSDKSLFNNLPQFDQFLNDVSGSNINFTYKNDYKINPLLKLNFQNINKVDSLLKETGKLLNFKERNEKISINPIEKLEPSHIEIIDNFKERDEFINLENIDKLKPNIKDIDLDENIYKNNFSVTNDYIFENYNSTKQFLDSIEHELIYLGKIMNDLKVRITYFKNEMNPINIKENVDKFIKIEKIDFPEMEIINGLDYEIKFTDSFPDKNIYIKNILLDNDEIYTNEAFIQKIYEQNGSGENLNDYFNLAIKYTELLKKRKIIKELTQVIEEYNLIYIQYYYYQFFILKNINKFNISRSDKGEHIIYQSLTIKSILTYWKILYNLNEIISKPEDIFSDINSRRQSVHSIFFFRYYYIIKNLLVFFSSIKELYEKGTYDETYGINLFKYSNTIEISKYILLFNFCYNILLNYEESFCK